MPSSDTAKILRASTLPAWFGRDGSGGCASRQFATDRRGKPQHRMSNDNIDLAKLGARLAAVRKTYSENIDLPTLSKALFATLIGVPVSTYQSYEPGETEPTVAFLVTLRKRTGISLDWLLDPD
jgi:hypothetical protein